jgi:methanethiol S-methyltransferase
MTAYILIGVSYEERDMLRSFGAAYAAYRQHTPMLVPWRVRRSARRLERHNPGEPTALL